MRGRAESPGPSLLPEANVIGGGRLAEKARADGWLLRAENDTPVKTGTLADDVAASAIESLPGIRKALVVIAKGQEEMLDLMESGPNGSAAVQGDREADDEPDDDEDSELADAVDADEVVEEEDHGTGAALIPDVLPARTVGDRKSVV